MFNCYSAKWQDDNAGQTRYEEIKGVGRCLGNGMFGMGEGGPHGGPIANVAVQEGNAAGQILGAASQIHGCRGHPIFREGPLSKVHLDDTG